MDLILIYDVDENTLNCRETVTAVEFCYSGTTNDQQREVFTLHTIAKQNDDSITVTNFIPSLGAASLMGPDPLPKAKREKSLVK